MNDIETIQKARGWRECSEHEGFWLRPGEAKRCEHPLPDPLADTPEGWFEFGQIIMWAHESGWRLNLEHYTTGKREYVSCIWSIPESTLIGESKTDGYPDFREAIIGAIAEAVRHESEDEK